MKNAIGLLGAVAVGTLVGCGAAFSPMTGGGAACAEPAPPPITTYPDRPCGLRHCPINVAIQQEPYPSCKLYVKADLDKLKMANKHQANIHLILVTQGDRFEFRLGGAGQEYSGGSMFFKGANAGSAPSQFTVPQLMTPKDLTTFNSNTNSLTYEYGIRVYDKTASSANQPKPLDPIIINDF